MINNMRDLGGTKTKDGKSIRKNMLVRSAHLGKANKEDLVGIAAVIDLRTPGERQEIPDQFHHCAYYPVPIFTRLTAGISHEEKANSLGIPDMRWLYRKLVSECHEAFENVLRIILSHDFGKGAILWHCTEGKDRCGLTTAMVLELLGVERKAIMEDYLKTNIVNMPKAIAMRQQYLSYDKEMADMLYRAYIADASYLEEAWKEMGNDYFKEKIQLDEKLLEGFRGKLLEM